MLRMFTTPFIKVRIAFFVPVQTRAQQILVVASMFHFHVAVQISVASAIAHDHFGFMCIFTLDIESE